MNNDEKKKLTGVSLFGQNEQITGTDPIEEMFALNLGDFISESLISEDLAKKISITASMDTENTANRIRLLIWVFMYFTSICSPCPFWWL